MSEETKGFRRCRCYPRGTFTTDLADAATPDDEERFWCAKCNGVIPPMTVGRLRAMVNALERIGQPDREGLFRDGPVTVHLVAQRMGKGHADEGALVGYEQVVFYRGKMAKFI